MPTSVRRVGPHDRFVEGSFGCGSDDECFTHASQCGCFAQVGCLGSLEACCEWIGRKDDSRTARSDGLQVAELLMFRRR